ncbi:MAG: hypothetical protein K2Y37_04255 [Pirellulales bacterium]|nr:hypothetical protein [Pirellulales bacterium]
MTDLTEPESPYAEQLRRYARALAAGRADDVSAALAEGSSPAHVMLFTEGNRAKRHEKLRAQLEFVAVAFTGFENLLAAYLRDRPPAASDTGAGDADRFLEWLGKTCGLTPEQHDYVACQRARHAVEAEAFRNRAGHVRFQELWATAQRRAAALDTDAGLRVHLNPIRAWSRFATAALLHTERVLPADVLFFAVGTEICTAVLEPKGRERIEELASYGPCTLNQWAGRTRHADGGELVELCRDLAEMGLVAFS